MLSFSPAPIGHRSDRLASLVTGIGYIGARLVDMLLDNGETVVGIDNLFSTDPSAIRRLAERPGFLFQEGDVADEVAVRKAFSAAGRVDTVYHLAAQASAHPSAAPIRYSEQTNLIGARVVLEQACEAGAPTFIFGGSIQVYGRRVVGTIDETAHYGPILDIAHLSKVYVEKLMEMYAHNQGLRCVSARLGLVYGVGPVMKTDPRFMTAPNKFCRQAAMGEPLRVDATAYHPTGMIHLDDVCRGLMALAQWNRDGFAAVNLVGETASVAQVALLVQRLAAERGRQVQIDLPAHQPSSAECSFASALSGCGFEPQISLEEGLQGVLDYFLAKTNLSPGPSTARGGELEFRSLPGKGDRGSGPDSRELGTEAFR
jgi:nucleoside-diphosphate-sugar epimerase